jgi:phage baseplate assembly protein W
MKIKNYKLNLDNALWVDVNTRLGQNNLPDRIADSTAIIHSSLFNLFNCAPGQRGRTFQPEYGSLWMSFIHEPISDITAAKMQMFMIDSVKRWEPRIELDLDRSSIVANTNIPGYEVRLSFSLPNMSSDQQVQFEVLA